MVSPDILDKLNPQQRAAVTHGEGPLLIVAGAGTGKTSVITRRVAWLIREGKCQADEILALTFTDAAAQEMENRLFDLLSFQEAGMRVGTFHSFGSQLLEQYAYHIGRSPGARLILRPEQILLLREHLDELPLDKLKPRYNPVEHLAGILDVISRLKNEDVTPARYAKWVKAEQGKAKRLEDAKLREARVVELAKQAEIAACYQVYEDLKLQHSLLDYDDQLTQPLEILRTPPDVLAKVRQRYRFVLVDEFQDTNVVQAELAYLVAGEGGNLTVVGDDDQSIYAFRAASLSNILEFEQRQPTAQRVVLTQNYRSTQTILDAAYRLIRHNDPERLEAKGGFDKQLQAEAGLGPEIALWHNPTIEDEADRAAELIKASHGEGVAYQDMAVLVPTHRDVEPFRQSLTMHQIPSLVERRQYLYQRPEIVLAVAFLRVVDNPLHSSSLRVLATSELYGLPADDLAVMEKAERRTHRSVWQQLADPPPEISEAGRAAAAKLRRDLEEFRRRAGELNVGQLLYAYLIEQHAYLARLGEAGHAGDAQTMSNLSTFMTSLKRFADTARDSSVHAWLHHFDHVADLTEEAVEEIDLSTTADAVPVITIHAAKGREFALVVLGALISDRLPGRQQPGLEPPHELLRDPVDKEAYRREQRRLCYVGMTRAKQRLVMTYPASVGGKRDNLKPSPFISEALPEQAAEQLAPGGTAEEQRIHRLRTQQDLPGSYQAPDPLVLSHSSIEAFRVCPWRYYWDYHVSVYLPPASQLLYGDVIHRVIQEINQAVIDGKPLDPTHVKQRFAEQWKAEGYLSQQLAENAFQQGERTVLSYLSHAGEVGPASAIEQPFKFKLEECVVSGRYDRLDQTEQGLRIIDYKTTDVATREEADKKLKDPRNKRQLLLYALANRTISGQLPAEVGLWFPEHNLVASFAPKDKQLDDLAAEINDIARQIKDGNFKHNPAQHECSRAACNRCPTNSLRNRGDFA